MSTGGSVNDFIDRLRVTAERNLVPFQRRDRFGELTGRNEGFALFVLETLHRLKSQAGLKRFGIEVKAHVSIEHELNEPVIVVTHDVKAIEEGLVKEPIDIAEFYSKYFPFNAVMQGQFSISRQDVLAQQYFKALDAKDNMERHAVVAIYCLQAADAFTVSDLRVVPPAPKSSDIPFITEPAP